MEKNQTAPSPAAFNEESTDNEDSVKVSNTVFRRLICGIIGGKRNAAYENYWRDKLSSMDEKHTKKNRLTVNEAEGILKELEAYVSSKSERTCPMDAIQLTDCLKRNKGGTLACAREVSSFCKCVNDSLHQAVSTNLKDFRKSKKSTYSESFEKKY